MAKINLKPTKCNLCGGKVIYTSNADVYHGKQFGSGYCYLCQQCGAYVGTHIDKPDVALGILANDIMRSMKINCHALFDRHWQYKPTKRERKSARGHMYKEFAKQMGMTQEECHFGYFDLPTLYRAYDLLRKWRD